MGKLTVIGGGPGHADYLLPAAVKAMAAADVVIADERFLPLIQHKDVRSMGKIMAAIDTIRALISTQSVAVVVSGDPLIYSLYKTIVKYIPEAEVEVIPGVGSLQMLATKLGETLENARFLSAHGRNLSEGALAREVYEHEKVLLLCDQVRGPKWMAETLISYGLPEVLMSAVENLSYPEEKWTHGAPIDFLDQTFESLCVVLIKNPSPKQVTKKPLLNDEDFIRDKTPMTKEEIRWTILGKMKLQPDSVLWDVGAGTGSISIEGARSCPFGQVYAIERYPEAVALIEKNKEKFDTKNLHIIQGMAAEKIRELPVPTHVFIGGSGKEMAEIVRYIASLGSGIKVMAACVTIETMAEVTDIFSRELEGYELVQMNVSRSRQLGGSYHILDSNNPVILAWGYTPAHS